MTAMNCNSSVMSSCRATYIVSAETITNAPKFFVNPTSNVRYLDYVQRLMKKINIFVEMDNKLKAFSAGAGYLIYLSCDSDAQDLLSMAEAINNIVLDGSDKDDLRKENMIKNIIKTIAKDSPTEIINRGNQMLADIRECKRGETENVSDYFTYLNGCVARYVDQSSPLSDFTSRRFAFLILRNAQLISDTMNSIVLQLTSHAKSMHEDKCNSNLSETEYNLIFCYFQN